MTVIMFAQRTSNGRLAAAVKEPVTIQIRFAHFNVDLLDVTVTKKIMFEDQKTIASIKIFAVNELETKQSKMTI